jgi:hypothetical protein
VKAGAFEEFHSVPGTPLAYSSKYTLLAYKVNWERFAQRGRPARKGALLQRIHVVQEMRIYEVVFWDNPWVNQRGQKRREMLAKSHRIIEVRMSYTPKS